MGLAWGEVIGIKFGRKRTAFGDGVTTVTQALCRAGCAVDMNRLQYFLFFFLFFFSFETWRKKKSSTMPSASSGPPASRDTKARHKTTSS